MRPCCKIYPKYRRSFCNVFKGIPWFYDDDAEDDVSQDYNSDDDVSEDYNGDDDEENDDASSTPGTSIKIFEKRRSINLYQSASINDNLLCHRQSQNKHLCILA